MKRIVYLTLGSLPLPIGYLLMHLAMYDQPLPLALVSLGMFVAWFLFSLLSANFFRTREGAMLFLNLPALLMLLLILFQALALRSFWLNHFGIATHAFYLPFMGLSGLLYPLITLSLHMSAVVAFVLMLAASFGGRLVGETIY